MKHALGKVLWVTFKKSYSARRRSIQPAYNHANYWANTWAKQKAPGSGVGNSGMVNDAR